jgi:hypothetical protein
VPAQASPSPGDALDARLDGSELYHMDEDPEGPNRTLRLTSRPSTAPPMARLLRYGGRRPVPSGPVGHEPARWTVSLEAPPHERTCAPTSWVIGEV